MARCNCARLATSLSGPRDAFANRSRASLNWRAWNNFMAASKLVNWLGGPPVAAGERARAPEFAGSERLFALGACGLLIRRSGIAWDGFFFSGIPLSPVGRKQERLAFIPDRAARAQAGQP